MKTIKQTYHINGSIEEVWQALVNPKYIESWGGGPAKMSAKVKTKFSLWGGSIWGVNIEVTQPKKLVQEWFSESENKKWDKPSIATFILNKEKNTTKLELIQTGVPEEDFEDINTGWKQYYLGPLKEYSENKKS